MRYIIGNVDPFLYEQKFMVMDGDKVINSNILETPRMADEIIKLAYLNDVYTIKLSGSKLYLNKFIKDILSKEQSYYSDNKITVEIV